MRKLMMLLVLLSSTAQAKETTRILAINDIISKVTMQATIPERFHYSAESDGDVFVVTVSSNIGSVAYLRYADETVYYPYPIRVKVAGRDEVVLQPEQLSGMGYQLFDLPPTNGKIKVSIRTADGRIGVLNKFNITCYPAHN
jgi:hypothetical protein